MGIAVSPLSFVAVPGPGALRRGGDPGIVGWREKIGALSGLFQGFGRRAPEFEPNPNRKAHAAQAGCALEGGFLDCVGANVELRMEGGHRAHVVRLCA